jgi:hypothetical protein
VDVGAQVGSSLDLIFEGRGLDLAFYPAIRAAGRYYGRDMDVETVYALSTDAFAPAVFPLEDEMARVTSFGRGHALDLVGRRYGLRVVRVYRARGRGGGPAERCRRSLPVIRAGLRAGRLMLIDGWLDYLPGTWGIATAVTSEGAILAASVNKRFDNRVEDVHSVWTVEPGCEETLPGELELAMLDRAVRRIHGQDSRPGWVLYGRQAYDWLIARFRQVPFCANCGPPRCGRAAVSPIYRGAQAGAAYLRRRISAYPARVRGQVERTADHYARIVELLRPAFEGSGCEGYEGFMGDLAGQVAHAETLETCKGEMVGAAAIMERICDLVAAARHN